MKLKLLTTLLLLSIFSLKFASPRSIVDTLPGYSGTLPFKLETGYISAGRDDEVQFFHYFIESEREPDRDPLMLWLTGGPGCSAFSGLVYEIGPLNFDFETFDGSLPAFVLNPYSWTKIASIIFLDAPVGTGFTYATTSEGYHSSDVQTVGDIYTFLQKWLLKHPNFIKNRLYIAGDSFAGYLVPMVVNKISQGIEEGVNPRMNIQGYVIGNPGTEYHIDKNSVLPFAHRMALISDKYYQMAKVNCHGEYENPDPNNAWCLYALQFYKECIRNIFQANILEPACKFRSSKPGASELDKNTYLEDDPIIRMLPQSNKKESRCRNDNYVLSFVWANDQAVQEALHVRKGTIKEWRRCNKSLSYDQTEYSVVRYHKLLIKKGYEALVYSGDHDMVIPYIGTLKWIALLNLTVDDDWRPWIVDGQVAGYTERYIYSKIQSHLTFATVKGAGHTAPEYKPKQCLVMLDRFFEAYPL
ncbi:serine carboxypeptidase-like 2 isoform X1 [Coffea arabica]|uniref:Serine carboxypeptidase-like 2 isoform X1 n=1 Tax=Coffea arabica TaxID=13443 RepID=A0ABM4VJ35_COFAR